MLQATTSWKKAAAIVVILARGMVAAGSTSADEDKLPKVRFSADKSELRNSQTGLLLCRPNQSVRSYLWLQNSTPDDLTVDVDLKAGETIFAHASDVSIPHGKSMPVLFKPAAGKSPEQKVLAQELSGPGFSFHVAVTEKEKGKPVGKPETSTASVRILHPAQYLTVKPEFTASDVGQNELRVDVTGQDNFIGGPCRLRLAIPPERNAGLVIGEASPLQKLRGPGDRARLIARNIRTRPDEGRGGYFYVDADEYERAFVFSAPYQAAASSVVPPPIGDVSIRQKADFRLPTQSAKKCAIAERYIQPAECVLVPLEVDVPPSLNRDEVIVEVGLDRSQDDRFEVWKRPGQKKQRVWLESGGEDGALTVRSEVADWVAEFDIEGMRGRFPLRLRLLDSKEQPLMEVKQELTIDATEPQGPRIEAPEQARRDSRAVAFRATATDPESGIKEVKFFLGEPIEEAGKLKAGKVVFLGKPDATPNFWTADIPLPEDKKGPLVVSAQFTNGAGLSSFAPVKRVELVEPTPGAKPETSGTISGVVVRGELRRPGLEVTLTDSAGATKKQTTNENGEFVFRDLAPGKYKVSSADPGNNTKGQKSAEVKSGETTSVQIELFLSFSK